MNTKKHGNDNEESSDDSVDLTCKDDGYIEIVLKMLGLMCDNQNSVIQVFNSPFKYEQYNLQYYFLIYHSSLNILH